MMETHLKTKEMVRDMLALIGQADIAVWEARELAMYPKLNRDFVDTLRNLNRFAAALRARWRTRTAQATVSTAVAVGNPC